MKLLHSNEKEYSVLLKQLQKKNGVTAFYSPNHIEYQKEYLNKPLIDLSVLFVENKKAVAGLLICFEEDSNVISGFGLPCALIEGQNISEYKKAYTKLLKDYILKLQGDYQSAKMKILNFTLSSTLGEGIMALLDLGGKITTEFNQIIDLTQNMDDIFKGVRKSYKSLINWGKKNLEIRVFDSNNSSFEALDNFRQLHIKVAGKETRSKKSWELQQKLIENDEAYLITGEQNGKLVTGAYFQHNEKTAFYGVSASDRTLFDNPISHVIVYKSIEVAKNKGCNYFELGYQYFEEMHPDIDKKMVDISKFKKGFGGKTFCQHFLNLDFSKIKSDI